MSAWEKIEKTKQEELKNSILVQVEDLVEDAADEIEEDTIEETGESIWDDYICAGVEADIESLGFENDYTEGSDFSQIWGVLNEYYWEVYNKEVDKLFE
jgi:hypothetical protein